MPTYQSLTDALVIRIVALPLRPDTSCAPGPKLVTALTTASGARLVRVLSVETYMSTSASGRVALVSTRTFTPIRGIESSCGTVTENLRYGNKAGLPLVNR